MSIKNRFWYSLCIYNFMKTIILSTVINCAFRIFSKTILQIVLPIKRLAKSFYKSADYASGQYNDELKKINPLVSP